MVIHDAHSLMKVFSVRLDSSRRHNGRYMLYGGVSGCLVNTLQHGSEHCFTKNSSQQCGKSSFVPLHTLSESDRGLLLVHCTVRVIKISIAALLKNFFFPYYTLHIPVPVFNRILISTFASVNTKVVCSTALHIFSIPCQNATQQNHDSNQITIRSNSSNSN